MNTKLFELKPCPQCKGTGDAHHQGHDYDCGDCLGTGFEEPAKRIMNLELMLKQHKEALKSSDAHNNELAQKLEIAWEQRDRLQKIVDEQCRVSSVCREYREQRDTTRKLYDVACETAAKMHAAAVGEIKGPHIDPVQDILDLRRERDRLAEALQACREDSVELLGERCFWQNEPRCDYQKRYQETRDNVTRADEALQSLTTNEQ